MPDPTAGIAHPRTRPYLILALACACCGDAAGGPAAETASSGESSGDAEATSSGTSGSTGAPTTSSTETADADASEGPPAPDPCDEDLDFDRFGDFEDLAQLSSDGETLWIWEQSTAAVWAIHRGDPTPELLVDGVPDLAFAMAADTSRAAWASEAGLRVADLATGDVETYEGYVVRQAAFVGDEIVFYHQDSAQMSPIHVLRADGTIDQIADGGGSSNGFVIDGDAVVYHDVNLFEFHRVPIAGGASELVAPYPAYARDPVRLGDHVFFESGAFGLHSLSLASGTVVLLDEYESSSESITFHAGPSVEGEYVYWAREGNDACGVDSRRLYRAAETGAVEPLFPFEDVSSTGEPLFIFDGYVYRNQATVLRAPLPALR